MLTLLLASSVCAWSADEHPRLLFTANELPALRARATAPGSLNAELLQRAKTIHAGVNMFATSTDAAASVQNLAILHALDDDAANTYGKLAVDVVHHWVSVYEPSSTYPTADVWFPHFAFVAMAMVYDMCFDLRTTAGYDTKLDDIRDELYQVGNVNQWRLPDMDRHPDNHHVASVTTLGLTAIAVEGDVADPQTTRWIAMAENFMLNHVDTTWTGGPYRGGSAYGGWTGVLMLEFIEALRRRDGLDFSRHPYLLSHTEYVAHSLLPNRSVLGDQRYDHLALNDAYTDRYSDFDLRRDGRHLFWMMERYAADNELASRVAYLWHHIGGARGNNYGAGVRDLAYAAMWYRERELLAPSLARSQTFRNQGILIGRRSWSTETADVLDQDNVHYSFVSGTFGGFEHRHSDSNSVTLTAFGDRILLDGGGFYADGAQDAAHHTAVTIDGDELLDGPQGLGDLSVMRVAVNAAWADVALGDATGGYTPYDGWWGTQPSRVTPQIADRIFAAIPGEDDTMLMVIADELRVDDGVEHEFRFHYATAPNNGVDLSSPDVFTITGANGSRDFDVHLVGPGSTLSSSTFSGGGSIAYQRVTASQHGGDAWQLSLVTPRTAAGTSVIVERHVAPNVLAARVVGDAVTDTVAVRRAGADAIDALGLFTDARAAGIRRDAAGELVGLWAIDATFIEADGVRVLETIGAALSIVAGPDEVVVEGQAQAFSVWAPRAHSVRTRELPLAHRRDGPLMFVEASGPMSRARGVDTALWREDFAAPPASFFQQTGALAFGVAPVGVQYRDGALRLQPFAADVDVAVNRATPLMGLSEFAGHTDFFAEPATMVDDFDIDATVRMPDAGVAFGLAAQLRFRQADTGHACNPHPFACGACSGGCGAVVTAQSFLALELDPDGWVRLRRGVNVAPQDAGELLAEVSHVFAADSPIALAVRVQGGRVRVSIDNVRVLDHTQAAPLAPAIGTIGWRLGGNVGAQLWVDEMSVTLLDATAPLPPIALAVTPVRGSLRVSWTPFGASPADFREARVFEVGFATGHARLLGTVRDADQHSFMHTGLARGSQHSYVVEVVDNSGHVSGQSPVASGRTAFSGRRNRPAQNASSGERLGAAGPLTGPVDGPSVDKPPAPGWPTPGGCSGAPGAWPLAWVLLGLGRFARSARCARGSHRAENE